MALKSDQRNDKDHDFPIIKTQHILVFVFSRHAVYLALRQQITKFITPAPFPSDSA
ncbi:MAG: hypothetical protein IPJ74_13190 [Saprospiraceae bacterium]|nr:hypothetical protein [Saprospiraceae bacterium]